MKIVLDDCIALDDLLTEPGVRVVANVSRGTWLTASGEAETQFQELRGQARWP